MSEHKIEREAVLWAWSVLFPDSKPTENEVAETLTAVLSGNTTRSLCKHFVVSVAIAYVESAKNHVDTILELETNLTTVTAERDALSVELEALRFRMKGLEK